MQALPTFTESGGHLSVPARAGATPITQSAPSPTAQRVRFMVGSSGAGGSSSSRPGVKGMVDSPEGHAANGSSLHCSSHRCPQRQRRWKWLPPRLPYRRYCGPHSVGTPWYRRFALEQDSRGACPRGKTEEVMGTVIRTTTVVAALFWLSVAPSLGQAAAPSSPCSRSACADDAGLSGFSGGVLSRCTNDVVKACKAGTCTCGTVTTTGTCGSMIASLCPPTT